MAEVQGTVEAVSEKYGKYSVLVNEVWYGSKLEYTKIKPNRGDVIVFDDGGRKFLSKVRVITSGGGSTAPSGGSSGRAPQGKAWSNLGVELGHAANVAKDMANRHFPPADIGSEDWYRFFINHTEEVFTVMKAIRERHENPPVTATPPPVKSEKPDYDVVSTDDIF